MNQTLEWIKFDSSPQGLRLFADGETLNVQIKTGDEATPTIEKKIIVNGSPKAGEPEFVLPCGLNVFFENIVCWSRADEEQNE